MVNPRLRLRKHWKHINVLQLCASFRSICSTVSAPWLVGQNAVSPCLAIPHRYVVTCSPWNVNPARHHSFMGERGEPKTPPVLANQSQDNAEPEMPPALANQLQDETEPETITLQTSQSEDKGADPPKVLVRLS